MMNDGFWSKKFRQYRYLNALFWFLILIIVDPFMLEEGIILLGPTAYSLLLISCGLAIARTKSRQMILSAIGLVSLYLTWMYADWSISGQVLAALYFFSCSVYILVDLWSHTTVTIDTLLGSILGLVLVAVSFAFVFSWLDLAYPGCIKNAGNELRGNFRLLPFLYFSFVNISTLGYGDLVPVHHGVRNLAALEAIFGQFYFASLVARLVSLHASGPKPE